MPRLEQFRRYGLLPHVRFAVCRDTSVHVRHNERYVCDLYVKMSVANPAYFGCQARAQHTLTHAI